MRAIHGCQEVPCAGAALTAALGQSPWHKSLTTLREAQDAGVQVNVVHLGATMASIAKVRVSRFASSLGLYGRIQSPSNTVLYLAVSDMDAVILFGSNMQQLIYCQVTPNILVLNTLIAALDKVQRKFVAPLALLNHTGMDIFIVQEFQGMFFGIKAY
eukprot:s504_g2.t1